MSRGRQKWEIGECRTPLGVLVVMAAALLSALAAPSAMAAPTIPLTTASQVTTTSAVLEADVNPGGKATRYRFEYGLAPCSANPCTTVPAGEEGKLPAGAIPVRVGASIEGLAPGTTYHFRAVAKNSEGEFKGPDVAFTALIVPAPLGPCPNEALRAGPSGSGPGLALPDCRAYEQASPVDKNGTSLLGELAPLRAASSGEAISFESSSGIPGGEGAQNFPYYLVERGAQDWSTQGLLPHGAAGDEAKVVGWTRDFAFSYSTARRSAAAEEALFARSSADGSLEPVVDYVTGDLLPAFAGASEDGARVFFDEAKVQLLPEAAAGKRNLYAWDRASGQLRLAGVLPDGSAPPAGAFAGPYDWISGTDKEALAIGGSARDYYTQDEHAVSSDGSRVFFTAAGTGQLYLRENPTAAQSPLDLDGECTDPAKACTLHVSKSQKTNGSGPNGTDAAGSRPAAFVGATPDGSTAFFTSSEKLTNDATTGPEPDTFPAIASAPKDDGDPVDFGFLPTRASGVTLAGEFIYWANPVAGTIERAKLSDPETIDTDFITGANNPQDVAVSAEHVYWTNAGDGKIGTGTIGRGKLDGEGVEEVNQDCVTGASNPEGIDVNATHVFWANAKEITETNKGTIGRAKLDCTEANQNYLEMAGLLEVPHGLAVTATQIYRTTNVGDNGLIGRTELDGSNAKFVALEKANPRGIALDATHVYWGANNAIGKAKLDLTDVDKEFIAGAGNPKGVAVNASDLFWAANQEVPANPGNDLYRYEAETGELEDLVVDTTDPNGAEVRGVLGISGDGSRLYFAANGDLDGTGPATKGNCQGEPLTGSGSCNLYLWEEGAIELVAVLETGGGTSTDAANWAATPSGVFPSNTFQKASRISADGGVLVFRSKRQLTAYENEGTPQYYRYDAQTGGLLCLTCTPTGLAPSGAPTLGTINAFLISAGKPASLLSRNLSADGRRFFFESTEGLVAGDTNGLAECPVFKAGANKFPACQDVYMWEASGTGSCQGEAQNGGCLYLLSTGKSPEPSFFADAGATGEDAFLLTSSPGLVLQDQDGLYDVYDARLEGGLLSQNEEKEICTALDPCHGPVTPQPAQSSPGTGAAGPGDPPPKRKACPKGKRKARVKGKARCVPKRRPASKKRQRKRHERKADTTRRASR
jgi:hypothetical protein